MLGRSQIRWALIGALLAGCDEGPRPMAPAPPTPVEADDPCLVRHLGADGIVTQLVRITHDREGRVRARVTLDYVTPSTEREAWAYDTLGRLVARQHTVEDRYAVRTTGEQHSYDAAGDRVRTTTLLLDGQIDVVRRAFDDRGRPVRVVAVRNGSVYRVEEIAYDARGRVVTRDLREWDWTHWEMAYDAAGRLVARRRWLDEVLVSDERWQWTDDGRLRSSTVDRDGDGIDDYHERTIDRVDGWERLVDGDGDGVDDRRELVRIEGERETTWTDADADGRFDAVLAVTRSAGETLIWADDDADGRAERVIVEIERPGYAETRRDDDGDGVIDARFVSRSDASGALLAEELYGPGDVLVEATVLRYDAEGRLVRVRRYGPGGALIERTEQGYACAWNPLPRP